MNQYYTIPVMAIMLSGVLGLVQHYQLLNGILYRCEGFGCMGAGIINLLFFVMASVVFGIIFAVFSARQKIFAFFLASGTSLFFNGVAISASAYLHREKVHQDVCEAIQSCQVRPEICTWELEESTRHQYPECFKTK
jgi:hypothetical protein